MSKKNNTPRRKRYNHKERLAKAPAWIKNYDGKNLIKGYANFFGVDKLCAIKELELSGVIILEEYKKQVTDAHKRLIEERRKKKKEKEEPKIDESELIDSDENFAFIAGYTSGGAPYGIAWDEKEIDTEMDEKDTNIAINEQNDELPF